MREAGNWKTAGHGRPFLLAPHSLRVLAEPTSYRRTLRVNASIDVGSCIGGAVAQLGARLDGIEEVVVRIPSAPPISDLSLPNTADCELRCVHARTRSALIRDLQLAVILPVQTCRFD